MNDGGKEDSGHFSTAYSLKTGEETKEHYKSWAATYDREVGEENGYAQPARTAKMLVKYQPDRGVSVLDAGCGSGLSGVALSKAGYAQLDGCDFSPEMLQEASAKNVYRRLFEADLNDRLNDTDDETYDALTCVGVFSFGHVSPDACDELLRILKRKGHLIIALNERFWNKGDLANKLQSLEAAGKILNLEKEYGEHLPGHNVNGWLIAVQKL